MRQILVAVFAFHDPWMLTYHKPATTPPGRRPGGSLFATDHRGWEVSVAPENIRRLLADESPDASGLVAQPPLDAAPILHK